MNFIDFEGDRDCAFFSGSRYLKAELIRRLDSCSDLQCNKLILKK